jgi:hypothetical protein
MPDWSFPYLIHVYIYACDATDGPRAYMLAPAGTGEMYLSVAWDGKCTVNVPGIAPITDAAGGQLIVKINEACTAGLWYSYIAGDVDGGELAVDLATGDIFGAVRRSAGEEEEEEEEEEGRGKLTTKPHSHRAPNITHTYTRRAVLCFSRFVPAALISSDEGRLSTVVLSYHKCRSF